MGEMTTTTIMVDGVHVTLETQLFDQPIMTVNDLLFVLRNIRRYNAKLSLAGNGFQLIKASDDEYILAPLGWEGFDDDEADLVGIHERAD